MPGKQFVGHLADLREGQHRGRQRVVADGPIDHGGIALDGGGDGHLLDAAGQACEQGALRRQGADMHGMEAGPIDENRHFHAGALRQVGDQAGVAHIAVELERLAALEGIDDVGGILVAALEILGGRAAAPSAFLTCSRQVASVCWYSLRM